MAHALIGAGLSADRVHTETFAALSSVNPGVVGATARAAPHPPPVPPGGAPSGPLVSFARSGVSAPWHPAYGSLLELAEACDVPTRWSCRTGVCHTCETPVLAGGVVYAPEPVDEPAAGSALVCCARPREDVVLDL